MSDDWPPCGQCGGIRIADGDSCLAHAEPGERAAVLKQLSESGDLDARGVTISGALLNEICDAAPRDAKGYPTFSAVQFGGATFKGDARFDTTVFEGTATFHRATFEGDAGFSKATFKGDAQFDRASFSGTAMFDQATFEGDARFDRVTFNGYARFSMASFSGDARFNEGTFEGDATFGRARFSGSAWFAEATFKGDAWFSMASFSGAWFGRASFSGSAWFAEASFSGDARFDEVTFSGTATFDRATFEGLAGFSKATFKGDARFEKATFQGYAEFGEVILNGGADFTGATFSGGADFTGATFKDAAGFNGVVFQGGTLILDATEFDFPVRIDADTERLSCCRARFLGGVHFNIRSALVILDDADLSLPSLLTGPSSPRDGQQPKLLSLRRANVAGLSLGNVDVTDCRFADAHNLDKLRVDANVVFEFSPARAGWERRQVIAEESAWRARRTRPGRWAAPAWPLDGTQQPEVLEPGAVTGLYRALRKGREDAKDEPGAADFYYGEMEMRRHDRGPGGANKWRGRATRILLWVYSLVSGYGQRAWRSLAALAVVTALFAVAFHYIGFTKPPKPVSYWTSVLYAFRSTISLTDSQVVLTAWGSFFQALLRITGPILLGLTLLAIRNRVKR